MNQATVQYLIDLNRRFYTQFGSSFASTRRRIQPGVRKVLTGLPDLAGEQWLDLGCGSGNLAVEWLRAARQSTYCGMDFSAALLDEARRSVASLPHPERAVFLQADLAKPGWKEDLDGPFAGVLSFAVLHHLPSAALRQQVLRQVAELLPTGGRFIHSVWQFQNSPKLWARRTPWEQVGLRDEDLEPGDTLLDWRAAEPEQAGSVGLRYVHLFNRAELAELAQSTGFEVVETFESDGQGGKLGLYQVWAKHLLAQGSRRI